MKKKYINLLLECIDLIKENHKEGINKYTRFYLSQNRWYSFNDIDFSNTINLLEQGILPKNYICTRLIEIGDVYLEINNIDNPSLSE